MAGFTAGPFLLCLACSTGIHEINNALQLHMADI
jgi:hypothetical protein